MSSGKTSLVPLTGLRSSFSEAAFGVAPPPTRLSASWSTAALALPPPAVAGGASGNVVGVITEVNVGRRVLCHHGVVSWFVGSFFRCCLAVWCCGAVLLCCGGFLDVATNFRSGGVEVVVLWWCIGA